MLQPSTRLRGSLFDQVVLHTTYLAAAFIRITQNELPLSCILEKGWGAKEIPVIAAEQEADVRTAARVARQEVARLRAESRHLERYLFSNIQLHSWETWRNESRKQPPVLVSGDSRSSGKSRSRLEALRDGGSSPRRQRLGGRGAPHSSTRCVPDTQERHAGRVRYSAWQSAAKECHSQSRSKGEGESVMQQAVHSRQGHTRRDRPMKQRNKPAQAPGCSAHRLHGRAPCTRFS